MDATEWSRRTILLGRVMLAVAVVMTATGLVLVERLSGTYEDGLVVAQDSARLVSDSIEPVSALATDLGALADELGAGIGVTRDVVASVQDGLDQVGTASSTNLAETATGAARISERLAGLVEAIERFIPGNSDSLAEDLRVFAEGLGPVAQQLEDLGEQLAVTADALDDADPVLAELGDRIDAVVADIDALGPNLRILQTTADDVRVRADEATTRLDLDRWLLRILIVLGGLLMALLGVVTERFAVRVAALERTISPDPSPG